MSAQPAIALMRELYPLLDSNAASDAFLTTWYRQASAIAGDVYFGSETTLARAHLLAHIAIKLDPAGLLADTALGYGVIKNIGTGKLSVGFGGPGVSPIPYSDDDLYSTVPGRAYLMLRAASINSLPYLVP